MPWPIRRFGSLQARLQRDLGRLDGSRGQHHGLGLVGALLLGQQVVALDSGYLGRVGGVGGDVPHRVVEVDRQRIPAGGLSCGGSTASTSSSRRSAEEKIPTGTDQLVAPMYCTPTGPSSTFQPGMRVPR